MLRKRRLNECSVNSAHSSRWLLIDHRFYYHLFRFPSAAPSTSPTPPPPPVFSWRYSVLPCLNFRLPFAFDSSALFLFSFCFGCMSFSFVFFSFVLALFCVLLLSLFCSIIFLFFLIPLYVSCASYLPNSASCLHAAPPACTPPSP